MSNEGIPGLPRTDEKFGNLPDIEKAGNLHLFATELHKQFGPVASFWFGQTLVVSTASPQTFKPQQNLFKRPNLLFENFKPLLGEDSIQFQNDEKAKELHKLIANSFSEEACAKYIPIFTEVAGGMAEEWGKQECAKIPLRARMMSLALRGLMAACFGDNFKCCNQCDLFEKNFDDALAIMEKQLAEQSDVLSPEFSSVVEKMRGKLCGIRKARKENPPSDRLLVDDLIAAAPSDQWFFSNAITNIVAGFRTTGNLLAWVFFYMTLHPGCQEEVHREIVQVLGNEQNITQAQLCQLKKTAGVVKEGLRLSVVAGYSARVSDDEDLNVGGFSIPKGTPILQSLGVAFQDEKQWTDPDKFDPSRFSGGDGPALNSAECPVFGFAGGRDCPAINFVFTEVLTYLSVLMRQFRLHLCEPGFMFATEEGCIAHPIEEIMVVPCKRDIEED